MATGGHTQDTDALLNHPDVVRVIRAILRQYAWQDQDVGDGVGDVQKLALEKTQPGKRPTTVDAWKSLVRLVAYDYVFDLLRKIYTHGKRDMGLTDGADDHAAPSSKLDPADRAKVRALMEQVQRERAGGKHTDVMLDGLMTGAPPREMAQDAGINPAAMRKQSSSFRALLQTRLGKVGITAAALAALVLAVRGAEEGWDAYQSSQQTFDSEAIPPPPGIMVDQPPRPRDIPNADKAAVLRDKALAECAQKDWLHCSRDLDMAMAYDPTGETLPEVQAARKVLAVVFSAKPR